MNSTLLTTPKTPPPGNLDQRAEFYANIMVSIVSFSHIDTSSEIVFNNIFTLLHQCAVVWNEKNKKYVDEEFTKKRFTDSTATHLDLDILPNYMNYQHDTITCIKEYLTEHNIQVSDILPHLPIMIYMFNLGRNLHNLDDAIIEAKAKASSSDKLIEEQKNNGIRSAEKQTTWKKIYKPYAEAAILEITNERNVTKYELDATEIVDRIHDVVISLSKRPGRRGLSRDRLAEEIRNEFGIGTRAAKKAAKSMTTKLG